MGFALVALTVVVVVAVVFFWRYGRKRYRPPQTKDHTQNGRPWRDMNKGWSVEPKGE